MGFVVWGGRQGERLKTPHPVGNGEGRGRETKPWSPQERERECEVKVRGCVR